MLNVMRFVFLAILSSLVVLGFSGAAGADLDDPYVVTVPSTAPETTTLDPQPRIASQPLELSAAPVAQVKADTLAFSGGDVTALAVIGAVLVSGGSLMLFYRRRSGASA